MILNKLSLFRSSHGLCSSQLRNYKFGKNAVQRNRLMRKYILKDPAEFQKKKKKSNANATVLRVGNLQADVALDELSTHNHRHNAINNFYFEKILEALSLCDINEKIKSYKIELIHARVVPNYEAVKVYFRMPDTQSVDEAMKLFQQVEPMIRRNLIYVKNMPPLIFVKDVSYSNWQAVEDTLAKLDFGPDFEPTPTHKPDYPTIHRVLPPDIKDEVEKIAAGVDVLEEENLDHSVSISESLANIELAEEATPERRPTEPKGSSIPSSKSSALSLTMHKEAAKDSLIDDWAKNFKRKQKESLATVNNKSEVSLHDDQIQSHDFDSYNDMDAKDSLGNDK